jgi:pimeloyl-ACP methyl ester carboxylesterase
VTRAKANGIEIEYETLGAKSNPAILLIMGLGAQLTLWSDAFCEGLAAKGFYVVRFDNRDCGLSTDFDSWGQADLPAAIMKLLTGKKIEAPYLVGDMAADAVGLVEALGLERAHMIGASMGGMIAQVAAAKYPARTRSLVSIMSTSSRPGLPQGKPEAIKATLERPATSDRETMVRHYMMLRRTIGSPAYPESDAEMRRLVERNIDRRYYPAGVGRQYLAILASGDRVELLKTVKVPTLVIHGADDPLLPQEGGRDVAALVPGAQLEIYPGMGHDLPTALTPRLVDRIATFCKAA